jgi:hypothetical protein
MPFQFRCPQGHLLEGENEDVGQVVHCPICGVALTIPSAPYTPTATPIQPPVPPYQQQQVPTADVIDTAPPVIEPEPETFPDVTANGSIEEAENEFALHTDDLQSAAAEQDDNQPEQDGNDAPDFESGKANQDELRIPCPNGHILDVTRDMLDEEAICPFCEEQFELKERNSIEAIEKRAILSEKREEKQERMFLYWGVGILVVGVICVITFMIIYQQK